MVKEFDFYIIPTPIGNIQDITLRAIETLKSVDLIACEDTRVTQKLLNHYQISTKCISYHKYNEQQRVEYFLKLLNEGKKIALVSDAGTPMICDPGSVIISNLINTGFSITSLPGASALTTFLSEIPRKNEEFTFIGFMPRVESQIKEVLQKHLNQNLVFYDSPERIIKTLKVVLETRGDIKVAIGRELSKLFEEIIIDNVTKIIDHFRNGVKGEIVCMIYANENSSTIDLNIKIRDLKNKGFKDKEISIILSTLYQFNKNDVYKKSLTTK